MKWSSFKYLVKNGWHNMVANRLMTLASIGVLSACLLITGIAVLLSVNVNSFVDYLGAQNEIEVFINPAATQEQIDALNAQLATVPNITEYTFVSKAQAVEEMKEYLGAENASVLNDYTGEGNVANPLPASFRIQITELAELTTTVEQIRQVGGELFYKISSPTELSNTLVNLRTIVTTIGWGLVIALGAISIVVISNTIRLTVFARRKEINIMKYVGATNMFIRLPFFVEGMSVGAVAGLIASLLVGGGYYALLKGLTKPTAMWLTEFTRCLVPFNDIIFPLTIGFVLFGMFIGSTGCATSIRQHLKV